MPSPHAAAVLLVAFGLGAPPASAAFTFSIGTPNTTLLPGRVVVPLYALKGGNTGGNDTGTRIKAFAPVFTASASGGFYVNADDGGTPGDASDDTVDLPNPGGVSPTLSNAGNGRSYVRLATAAQTIQLAVTPGSADPYVAGNAARGIVRFGVIETTNANVNAGSTVNGGLGFRVAVLVVSTSVSLFTLSGQVAGDTGTAQNITPKTFFTIDPPPPIDLPVFTPSVVTLDVSPPGLEGFGPVSVTSANTAISFGPLDPRIADNVAFGGSGRARSISGSGFTYADRGTYVITAFTESGGSATFTLNVVPEPSSLGVAAPVAFVARRSRPRRSA